MPTDFDQQSPQVVHVRDRVPGAVYIGRGSKWGNPFKISARFDRDHVILLYRWYLERRPDLVEAAKTDLRDKDLACFCTPLPCHGDILAQIANGREGETLPSLAEEAVQEID